MLSNRKLVNIIIYTLQLNFHSFNKHKVCCRVKLNYLKKCNTFILNSELYFRRLVQKYDLRLFFSFQINFSFITRRVAVSLSEKQYYAVSKEALQHDNGRRICRISVVQFCKIEFF